ncbi:mitogen-activated protein kinase kinase kinase 14 isoform X3 [Scophthalmus maximus]|uniref:mitogen-activated protein kinase kinase kinase 14 isoform X3 n=1 Tax=Scophthalmus maximus TaxID=52904 RepID=UPI001FA8CED6|nr:mitogen-activated protein kinase kinase kinase 14 isoform X3 [Scophthalmus maximus]
MAIPRVFNSNTPFIIVTGGSELSFHGKEDGGQCGEEEKDSLVQAIAPHLSRVMQRGTAKHVVTAGQEASEENACVSIVAQAEREDFQEFSPTTTQCPYSRSQQLKKLRSVVQESSFVSDTEDEDFEAKLHRKQRRRSKTRPSQGEGEGEERPVIRGLWVQEIDWLKSVSGEVTLSLADVLPPPPQFTDAVSCSCSRGDRLACMYDDGCSCADVCACVGESEDQHRSIDTDDTSSSEDRGGSDSDCGPEQDSESIRTHESDSDSSCCAEDDEVAPDNFRVEANVSNVNTDLMHVSGHNACRAEWDSDSTQSMPGLSDSVNTSPGSDDLWDTEVVLDELRGRVTRTQKQFVSPFFEDLIKQTVRDGKHNVPVNEGLVFHHLLQPRRCRYREGEEYCVLHHVHNGSYGDVFCVRDKATGFECAAKRIPLSHFSREEVSTWSALNSPRVVELFGAVRDGANVVLFMDLKPACLAQLLKETNCLPEDLALHYLHQSLGALEHLHHRKVLHLDVKVDNVLLSADCRDTFLCDFGLSETADEGGRSGEAFRGAALPGTESHMAPEVARGDPLCAKADVWSSCCMLLHMLNGFPPWTRYYSHPLCLQIVNEPPPLWEVPSTCNNFTAKVFRAGLRKDPDGRASAKELRRKTTKALRAVGGLSSCSVRTACEILHRGTGTTPPEDGPRSASAPAMHWKGQRRSDSPWGSEPELEFHRDNVASGARIQTPSPEPRDDPPSCFSCSDTSQVDASGKDSDHSSDDLSSGVFSSCNSRSDGRLEWSASANQPHSYRFEGVDIWIENVQGECLRIRERRQVKVGHVAVGISEQISGKAFTLETLDRKSVSFEAEITESCVWLRCVPAPDTCRLWRWRVRDGKLELQE